MEALTAKYWKRSMSQIVRRKMILRGEQELRLLHHVTWSIIIILGVLIRIELATEAIMIWQRLLMLG